MTVSNGAYQHHQEEMQRQQNLSQQRRQSFDDYGEIEGDGIDNFFARIYVFFPLGLFSAFAAFMEIQEKYAYFDTDVTWELWALIASLVSAYIVGVYVLPVLIMLGIAFLFCYCLYHVFIFII